MSAQAKIDQTTTPVAANPRAGICSNLSEGTLIPIRVNPSLIPCHGFKLKTDGGHFTRIAKRFTQYFLSDECEPYLPAAAKTGDLFMGMHSTLQPVATQELIQIFGKDLNGIPLCISSLEQVATLVEMDYARQQTGQTPSYLTRDSTKVNVFIVPQKVIPQGGVAPLGAPRKPCAFTFGKTKESTHSSDLIYQVGQDSFILRELIVFWDHNRLGWNVDVSPIVAPDRQHAWIAGAHFFQQDIALPHGKVNEIVQVGTPPDKTIYRRDQPSPRHLPEGYPASSV